MSKVWNLEALKGKHVNLRDYEIDDAEFILYLRTDEKKAQFLMSKTENDIQKQVDYIKNYKLKDNEWNFIVESKAGERLGTVGIYDLEGDSFSSGRWLMSDSATFQQSIESDILVKKYGFDVLGFDLLKFDVKKSNKNVLKYHLSWGAKIINEDDDEYFFVLSKEDFNNTKDKFKRFL